MLSLNLTSILRLCNSQVTNSFADYKQLTISSLTKYSREASAAINTQFKSRDTNMLQSLTENKNQTFSYV